MTMRIENAGMSAAMGINGIKALGKNAERPSDLKEDKKVRGRDEYLPSEEEESAGIYQAEVEDGRRVIRVKPFEEGNPPKADEENSPKAGRENKKKSSKSEDGKAESCACNTDKVDRELKALKEKIKRIGQQAERAEGKERERLSKELAALESELARKDCDSYRRSRAEFS